MNRIAASLCLTVFLLGVMLLPVAAAPSAQEISAEKSEFAFVPIEAQAGKSVIHRFFSTLFRMLYRAYVITAHRSLGILSRINAKQHREHNRALDEALCKDGKPVYIFWQEDEPIRSMRYGTRTMDYNGCELVAVYNILLEFGVPKKMSDIVYDFESSGSLWLEGEFGTKIAQYRKYLEAQGFAVKEFRDIAALDAARRDGDVFLITYQNKGSLTIHTVMVVQVNGALAAFNGPHYESFESLGDEYLNGFKIIA